MNIRKGAYKFTWKPRLRDNSVKYNVFPLRNIKSYGGSDVELNSFSNSALFASSCQVYAPAAHKSLSRGQHGYEEQYCTFGVNSKLLVLPGIEPRILNLQSVIYLLIEYALTVRIK
jgi:hypothetical protein